jgi:ATP-binding cassette subfamily C protein
MAVDMSGLEPSREDVAALHIAVEPGATAMNSYQLLIRDLTDSLGWRFPVLVGWTALVGIGEGLSVVLLLPLLNRMGVSGTGGQGMAARWLDAGLESVGATGPFTILIVIVAIAALQAALAVALTWWSARLARRYASQRQLALFSAFMRAKWSFLVDRKAGELTSAITTECERLSGAFSICLTVLGVIVVTVIYIALSLLVAWQVTIALIAFAVVAAVSMTKLYGITYAIGQSLAPLNTEFQSDLMENFAGAKFIKATYSGVDRATARVALLVRKLESAYTAANAIPGTVRSLLEFFAFVSVACVLVVSSIWGGVAAANVFVVLALFGRLFPRMTTMYAQLHHLNWNVHALDVVHALQSAADAQPERAGPAGAEQLTIGLPAALVVRGLDVTFGDYKALDGVDLRLPMPGLVAVVGGSGAGKSTLVHTLLGLIEPSAGSIELGANAFASTSLSAWRRAIGYVPQEAILFHASIRQNLIFANPEASAAEVEAAARRAHAHDFIMALPDGYETIVGDQGMKLSGGQRQRLGIARALLVNPVLLVLDEAMSALDAESEREILSTLEELRTQMGILIIAHRLAAVSSADLIYVLQEGRVAESGTWDDLMARGGRLHALAGAQGLDRVAASAH